ncbi:MAG: hypothetical protein JWN40_4613 [Phycisphaerales bacterium]|nr:hypothetical protein [Phycisphaerales bacterium]
MKRFTTLLALALILSLGAGVTYAAKGDKAAAKAAKAAKGDKAGKKDGIMGTVVKADDKSITVQTRGKKGAEVTVAIDASTKFEGVATAADIKPGQHIMATPNVGTATKVTVQAGKGDKAGKKAAKKAAK